MIPLINYQVGDFLDFWKNRKLLCCNFAFLSDQTLGCKTWKHHVVHTGVRIGIDTCRNQWCSLLKWGFRVWDWSKSHGSGVVARTPKLTPRLRSCRQDPEVDSTAPELSPAPRSWSHGSGVVPITRSRSCNKWNTGWVHTRVKTKETIQIKTELSPATTNYCFSISFQILQESINL